MCGSIAQHPHIGVVVPRVDEARDLAAAAEVVADVPEQVEELVAARVEQAPRDAEELARRHAGLGSPQVVATLDPLAVGDDLARAGS